ncbi:phage tail assembly chaperone [Clostridium sp.]|uniref:phage tail assembly chaperone n=1 Tax=Clostridium sp. TaxID=1506 RepID=UPI003463B010
MESHTDQEGWDWEWLFYLGTNLLKMTEEQFWRSTPKKLQALFNVYKRANGVEEEEELDYIDNIIF